MRGNVYLDMTKLKLQTLSRLRKKTFKTKRVAMTKAPSLFFPRWGRRESDPHKAVWNRPVNFSPARSRPPLQLPVPITRPRTGRDQWQWEGRPKKTKIEQRMGRATRGNGKGWLEETEKGVWRKQTGGRQIKLKERPEKERKGDAEENGKNDQKENGKGTQEKIKRFTTENGKKYPERTGRRCERNKRDDQIKEKERSSKRKGRWAI